MSLLTKKALASSLKNLMTHTTLDKITVQEIADNCGVNRQTFYYHFQDVYALLEWICTQETLHAVSENDNYENWQQGFLLVFEYITENRAFCQNAFKSLGREHFEKFLFTNTFSLLYKVVDELSEGMAIAASRKKFITNFYSYAFIGLVVNWLETGMKENPREIIAQVESIISGNIKRALEHSPPL